MLVFLLYYNVHACTCSMVFSPSLVHSPVSNTVNVSNNDASYADSMTFGKMFVVA